MISDEKIVLISNFLPDRQESMLRFTQMLADGLAKKKRVVEIWRPEPWFTRPIRYRYGGLPKYLGYLDKFLVFPRTIRRQRKHQKQNTVYHIVDHSNAMYLSSFEAEPVLVTCHDLLQVRSALGEFPQNRLTRSGQNYQKWILRSLANAKQVACVSKKTQQDLQRLTNLSESATPVVPNGLNYPYRPLTPAEAKPLIDAALAQHNLTWPAPAGADRPSFLLGIGGAQWYKNRTGLIALFAALQKRVSKVRLLVYVGPPFASEQTSLIARHQLGPLILRIPSVSNEALQALYSLADGLLFPSWEEGFGWPIAEAQACGCPVFTSFRPPMTEVGGNAAVYFDPADIEGASDLIAGGLHSSSMLRAAGLALSSRWQSAKMIEAYLRLYKTIAKPPEPALSSAP